MQSSAAPTKFPAVWGYAQTSTYLQPVPTLSTGTLGAASLQYGFNSETFQPLTAGGVGPKGEYINGFNQQLTANIQWQQAGGWYTYDSAFSTAIGGYPKGALLKGATVAAFWQSTVENNTVNPDTGSLTTPAPGWRVLQPGTYPWSQITGAPNVVVHADFTTGQIIGPNGSQDTPDGYRNQWMEIPVANAGGSTTLVNVTYPEAFPTTSYKPRALIFDPSMTSGASSNFVVASPITNTLSGCQVIIGPNGGGGRDVTLMVDVRGRTL